MSEDDIECKSFTVISPDSLLVYENKYYLLVYWDNCAYKMMDKGMVDYLNDNFFWDRWRIDLINAVLWYNWYKQMNWSY